MSSIRIQNRRRHRKSIVNIAGGDDVQFSSKMFTRKRQKVTERCFLLLRFINLSTTNSFQQRYLNFVQARAEFKVSNILLLLSVVKRMCLQLRLAALNNESNGPEMLIIATAKQQFCVIKLLLMLIKRYENYKNTGLNYSFAL